MTIYLKNKGWVDYPATLSSYKIAPDCKESLLPGGDYLQWQRVDIPELYWSHTASLLILQGLSLQHFFADCSILEDIPGGGTCETHGPYMLLKGTASEHYDPPARLTNVVLARLTTWDFKNIPEHSFAELFGVLLDAVSKYS